MPADVEEVLAKATVPGLVTLAGLDGREAVLDLHSSSEVGAAFRRLGLTPEVEHEGLVRVNAETAASARLGARASVALGAGVALGGREMGAGAEAQRHDDSFRATDRLPDDVDMKVSLVEEISVSKGEWLAVHLEAVEA